MARILVADDEPSICEAFAAVLATEGHEALIASNGRDAVDLARTARPDAVFLDVRMPGLDGLAALKEIRAFDRDVPVIVMTAYGTLDTAAEALRNDAFDYLGKPLELAKIRQLLRRALHARTAPGAATVPLEPATTAPVQPRQLVGQSPAMQEIFKRIILLADNELGVLVQGESGTGKELVARAVHTSGRRAAEPFVAINCAAIPETLMESELFGHERGAFTDAKQSRPGRFELAGQGTLFLDEISELPIALQSKLLRVLQERTFERVGGNTPIVFKARLVCATNRELAAEVAAGRFREDLFHRINLVTLNMPPLRERRDDIAELVRSLLAEANREAGKSIAAVEQAVLDHLRTQDWPGNVRELEHVIKRAVLTSRGSTLTVHDLEFDAGASPAVPEAALERILTPLDAVAAALVGRGVAAGETPPPIHDAAVSRLDRALIAKALEATGGNQVAAARLLGISRSTLRSKISNPGSSET
jgi:DNA-binding NtrC family response regulator